MDDAPSEPSVLGAWLKDLREQAGLSLAQAGQTIGVSDREIRRWEKKNAPGGIALLRLLFAYNVRLEPPPPDQIPGAVNAELAKLRGEIEAIGRRLTGLEARVARQGKAETTALAALAALGERIEQRLEPPAPPANRRAK